jgi:hypothetical protein
MSLEDAAQRLAAEQRDKNAAAVTTAEARQARMATPTREDLEFVSFCHKHGVAAVPIRKGSRQKRWSRMSVDMDGRGWLLNGYDGGSQAGPQLCVWEDGTVVTVTGSGPYSLREPVDPADLPWWVGSERSSLANLLTRVASNILIKKEKGTLHPPY